MNENKPFTIGQRVYCPTYGAHGTLIEIGDLTSKITLHGVYGIGSVMILNGYYEHPLYKPPQPPNEAVDALYDVYCKTQWARGEEALGFTDWLIMQVDEFTRQKISEKD